MINLNRASIWHTKFILSSRLNKLSGLYGAKITKAHLRNTTFKCCNLEASDFSNCSFDGVIMEDSYLYRIELGDGSDIEKEATLINCYY